MTNNEMTGIKETKLFPIEEKTYGEKFNDHLLEQYKLYVEMADNNSERRSKSNTFYLTLVSALITIIGVLSQVSKPIGNMYFWWVALVSISGIVFCLIWNNSIKCYRVLSEAKFKVIHEMEKRLPVAAFAKEWDYLNQGSQKTRYPQLTLVERWIPLTFLVLFLSLLVISLVVANFSYLSTLL